MSDSARAFWDEVLDEGWQRRGPAIVVNRIFAKYQLTIPFQEAEDLFSEALERILKNESIAKLQRMPAIDVRRLLFGYLRNVVREWFRKTKRHPSISLDGPGSQVALEYQVESLIQKPDLRGRIIREARDALEPEERLIFELYYFDGRTQQEISDYMSCSIGTVNGLVQSSSRKFRDVVDRVCEVKYEKM